MRFAVAVAAVIGAAALAAHRAARGRRLGATARRGPRTGAVEVDDDAVRVAVDQALKTFEPCDPNELDQPVAGYLTPPVRRMYANAVRVREVATGEPRTVPIAIDPLDRVSGTGPRVSGKLWTRLNPDGSVAQQALVFAKRYACEHRNVWQRELRATLAHELAHASDTGLRKRIARGGQTPRHRDRIDDAYVAYLNHPEEIVANLTAVRGEVEGAGYAARRDLLDMPPDYVLRAHSPRWDLIEDKLTPANRQRFLRMAARLADQAQAARDTGQRKAEATWRKRLLVEHVTKRRRQRRTA